MIRLGATVKHLLRLAILLLLAQPGWAAIAFRDFLVEAEVSAASYTTTGFLNTQASDTAIIFVEIRTTTSTISSITDTIGNTIVFESTGSGNNGTSVRIECWRVLASSATNTTNKFTVTLSAASKTVFSSASYSGVAALGAKNFATASAANPSISITTQDANNFVVAGFAGQGTGTFTAGTGNLRGSAVTSGGAAASNVGGALVDNTAAAPGSVTDSVTNADTLWALGAIELRSSTGAAACANFISLLGVGCK